MLEPEEPQVFSPKRTELDQSEHNQAQTSKLRKRKAERIMKKL